MESLSRPVAPRSSAERARAWIEWFGIGRLVAAAFATVVVCAGGYWLVSSPPPPTEALLPRAQAPSSTIATQETSMSPETTAVASAVVVHVAGSVVAPGVYELAPGARVRDAIAAAGGAGTGADANALNLAAVVVDASRVYVPAVGEEVPSSAAPPVSPVDVASGPVDLNRASVEQLDELPGIGPATANAIVTERDRNGPFLDVDGLDRVPGIGPAKLAALRDLVTT